MRYIISSLILLPVILWFILIRKKKDVLSPENVYTVLYIIKIIIPVLFYSNINNVNSLTNINLIDSLANNHIFLRFVIMEVIGYFLVIFGMNLRFKNKKSKQTKEISPCMNRKKYCIAGICFWIIGFTAFLLIIKKLGGLTYYLSNLQYRSSLTRDLDLLTWFLNFLSYGCILIAFSYKKQIDIKLFMFAIITGLIQGLGARKPILILVLEIIFIYHYTVNKIDIKKFFKVKYLIGAIIIYMLFILLSSFRAFGTYEQFKSNPKDYFSQLSNSVVYTISRESYVPFYTLTLYYFDNHSYWYGSTFKALFTAFIPSSIYPEKPPTDDGMYLYSIALGRDDIEPIMSYKSLNGSSYPLETFGSMYSNFGIVGYIIGMILLGFLIGVSYRKMERMSYSLLSVVIYINVLITFELSTLRIVQLLITLFVFGILFFIIQKTNISKKEESIYEM